MPDVDRSLDYLSQGETIPIHWGADLRETSVHRCVDGRIGIIDLIGGVAEDDERPGDEMESSIGFEGG